MEIKLIIAAVAAIALILLGFWGYHEIYSAGHTAGAAEVQSQFDSYRLAQAALVAAQVSDNSKKAALAQATIDRERADYTAKLAASNSAALQFASRLRSAENRSCPAALPANPGGPGSVPSSQASSANGAERLSELVAAYDAECADNANALDALYADIKVQLPAPNVPR